MPQLANLYLPPGTELCIKDDAGVARPLDWGTSGQAIPAGRAVILRQAADLLDFNRSGSRHGLPILIMFLAHLVSQQVTRLMSWGQWMQLCIFWAFIPLMWWAYRRESRKLVLQSRDRVVAYLTSQGLCPACAYDLGGVQAGDGGRVTCPECAALWDGARLTGAERFWLHKVDDERRVVFRPWADQWKQMFRPSSRLWHADDRGRDAKLLTASLRDALTLSRSGSHAERAREAWRRARRSGRVKRCIVSSGVIAFLWGVVLIPLLLGPPAGGMGGGLFLAMMVLLPLFAAIGVWTYRGTGFADPHVVRARMVEQRICPVCLSDLAGRDVQEDGCCVCGVCGAAWRVDGKKTGSSAHSLESA